jgi:hypothetical protein
MTMTVNNDVKLHKITHCVTKNLEAINQQEEECDLVLKSSAESIPV